MEYVETLQAANVNILRSLFGTSSCSLDFYGEELMVYADILYLGESVVLPIHIDGVLQGCVVSRFVPI